LGSEHRFPRHVEASDESSLAGELAGVRNSMESVGDSLTTCRAVLHELELKLGELGRQLCRLEAIQPDFRPTLALPYELPQDEEINRVDHLRVTFEAMLKRPLRTSERPLVLRWAQLERGGQLVPIEEIIHVAGRLLARRTPEGTLPGGLAWCDTTVQALARGAAGPTPPRGMDAAAEFATLYEKLADHLDTQ
jgi:hypothetical protein